MRKILGTNTAYSLYSGNHDIREIRVYYYVKLRCKKPTITLSSISNKLCGIDRWVIGNIFQLLQVLSSLRIHDEVLVILFFYFASWFCSGVLGIMFSFTFCICHFLLSFFYEVLILGMVKQVYICWPVFSISGPAWTFWICLTTFLHMLIPPHQFASLFEAMKVTLFYA